MENTPVNAGTTGKIRLSPKDFFLYLGVMVMLYVSVVAFIGLLFEYINYSFPDELQYWSDPYAGALRWWMALLIVVVPAFLAGTWYLNSELRRLPEKRELGFRRWLTYLALFVAGVTMLIDLSTLVYYFLGGDITTRFALKVLAVFAVSGIGFGYYLLDLRGRIMERPRLGQTFGVGVGCMVLLALIASFFVVGSPVTQKQLRLDEQRVNDLQNIQSSVISYWTDKKALPENLDLLTDSISGWRAPTDPELEAPYEYQRTGPLTFELCAQFAQVSVEREGTTRSYPYANDEWKHKAGRTCFTRTIDPDRYPPRDSVMVPKPVIY